MSSSTEQGDCVGFTRDKCLLDPSKKVHGNSEDTAVWWYCKILPHTLR